MAVTNGQLMKKLAEIEAKIDALKPKSSNFGGGVIYPANNPEPVKKEGNLVRPSALNPPDDFDWSVTSNPDDNFKPFTPVTWETFKKVHKVIC